MHAIFYYLATLISVDEKFNIVKPTKNEISSTKMLHFKSFMTVQCRLFTVTVLHVILMAFSFAFLSNSPKEVIEIIQ